MDRKKTVVTGFLWRLAERFGAQGVTLIVSIVLARLLDPEVYGTLALVTVFTSILQVFVDSGFASALIQKKDADDLDFSSVFYFNIAICLLLYAGMFFAAPWISAFYNRPELVPVVRVMSLIIVISGVKNVQQAYVSRTMQFKRFFFATLGGTIGAAVLGIWMAWRGYGVWALVAQHLFNMTVDTLILWLTVKWRPKRMFSWQRLKTLISFGGKLLVAKLIDRIYNECRALVIGKKYTAADLAYYDRGWQFPNLITNNINDSIDSVLFPVMSQAQNNIDDVRNIVRRAIKTSTFIMAPMMFGLAAVADSLIPLLLGEKWQPCIFYLRIFCTTLAFYPIHTANLNAIAALGRSDISVKIEIIKKVLGLSILFVTMWFGVKAIALGALGQSLLNQIINSWPNRKLISYRYGEQLLDILPAILLSLAMAAVVYAVTFLHLSPWATLLIQIPLGVGIYVLGAKLFHMESYEFALDFVKKFLKKHD
ncbi:MAG: lipopolysaccharide biosynthesis protein [Oscillospiraceae bacterium]|nr:lipopolysaccharide biosynthesis protein [Oscillospiraceae bacterium]